jgi:hypothetical protein
MSQPLTIIIVEKGGSLKPLSIKDFQLDDLYKKCGFKKSEHFEKTNEWSAKFEGKKYYIELYGKTDGRANSENKYDFPPPMDNVLFFGNCALIGHLKKEDGTIEYIDISVPLWKKIYEKLFGGFEDLSSTAIEDENEEDELANVPKEKKTKNGYLKDGFVVDSSDTEENEASTGSEEGENGDNDDGDETEETEEIEEDGEIIIEDLGSELSEESYDYDPDP